MKAASSVASKAAHLDERKAALMAALMVANLECELADSLGDLRVARWGDLTVVQKVDSKAVWLEPMMVASSDVRKAAWMGVKMVAMKVSSSVD